MKTQALTKTREYVCPRCLRTFSMDVPGDREIVSVYCLHRAGVDSHAEPVRMTPAPES
jgi:DNA-directed RNA polymerase subunit RPC12/RpoP